MKTNLKTRIIAVCLALPLTLALAGAAAAQEDGDCLSGQQIQQAIVSGEIRTVDEALSAEGLNERPLSTSVCKRNGMLEYHVNTMDSAGGSNRRVLNAQGS